MGAATAEESLTVWVNRYDEARAAGLAEDEAQKFADSDSDIGELRKLVNGGCPPRLIARLVL